MSVKNAFLKKNVSVRDVSALAVSANLREQILIMSEKCIKCTLCEKECAFLRKYGKPKDIADSYDPNDKLSQGMPFECSLCQLCAAVCPVKINPAVMFLEMRRQTVKSGKGDFPEHSKILSYEKRGSSAKYTFYSLPEGCDTIFFPGCALSGSRPKRVIDVYMHLRQNIPNLGIVLDCCLLPSHDLGRSDHFQLMFDEMKTFLLINGVRRVIVACPSCHKVFNAYGDELTVKTAYEQIAETELPPTGKVHGVVTVHDACALRFETPVHNSIRGLVSAKGLTIEEMPHQGERAFCCGEGGSVGFINHDLAKNWGHLRKKESRGKNIITYCAGCTNFLGSLTPTSHVLDLIFEPEKTVSGTVKVSKAPFTYLNRLRLKKHFKKTVRGAMTRERTFSADDNRKKGGMLKRVIVILLLIAAIFAIRFTGATRYLQQDELRTLIHGYGALAPILYMLFYTLAPALFLPGLPITIAGGILFGPFWGVVYTITSATAGACVAFLISRYVARGWIEQKLRSPRWRQLDEGVEKHGWKIVAVTRLIPLFPFNLLNYAFGLSKIKFVHYALSTFFCMLPACIAFIVFSSSLLDLFRGRVSPAFIIGLVLLILVSLIPALYNRLKDKRRNGNLL
jgi:uncharacterized membrane protein YdjX (TVP38/TMEM64 family)/Fe-S oxidoreductase